MPEAVARLVMNWEFVCDTCDFRGDPTAALWRCPACGSALTIEGLDPLRIQKDAVGLWRYTTALPVGPPASGTNLGEGSTPLVPIQIDGHTVHLKLDSQLPTGSFKDRGAAVLASYLGQIDIQRIIVDSSGNAAAAMAAYSASLDLDCTVFVPASASPGKLVQARAHGAEVVPVDGSRDDVAHAAQDAAERDTSATYASHNWHPVFVEGVKTWAFEVFEQLGGRPPDVAFVPTGGGSAFVGAWRGFNALDGPMPRLVACQPVACAPVVRAWFAAGVIERVEQGSTIAEGTRIALPSRPNQIMRALRESQGWATAVDEGFLIDTLRLLWRRGVYAEPTGALGVAACRMAIASGDVTPGQTIVAHVTGHGLKATGTVEGLLDHGNSAQ